MASELLWKRAVRRAFDSLRGERFDGDFRLACELSAMSIDMLRRYLAGSDNPSDEELDRRVSRFRIEMEQVERRMATSWRTVRVTVKE
jgi:hypothetical protein